jgi:ATP-dependent DNA helicase
MRLDESQGKDSENYKEKSRSSPRKKDAKASKSPRKPASTLWKKANAYKTAEASPGINVRKSGRQMGGRLSRKLDDDDEFENEVKDMSSDDDSNIPVVDGTISPTNDPTAPRSADSDAEADSDTEAETITFPVVITTYEMIIRDRVHLAHYDWGYIVVDEGHRLKNLDCKLMREIKKYPSAGRMILTGTPLHVSFYTFFFCKGRMLNVDVCRIIWRNFGRCSILFCLIYLAI